LPVQFSAIVAEPIVASALPPFPGWDVASWRAGTVVMVDLLVGWLVFLVDRVKRIDVWH
jgi:hypothetical protein